MGGNWTLKAYPKGLIRTRGHKILFWVVGQFHQRIVNMKMAELQQQTGEAGGEHFRDVCSTEVFKT